MPRTFSTAVFLLACDLGGRPPVEADAGLCEDLKTGMIYMRRRWRVVRPRF
jgi:hypothetical protein